MSKHTATPWSVVKDNGKLFIVSDADGGTGICEVYNDHLTPEECEANARRIVKCVNTQDGKEYI